MLKISSGNKGFSILEVLIASFIVVIILTSFLGIMAFSFKSSRIITVINKADFLAEETVEAVRSFRSSTVWSSDGLGSLTVGTNYHLTLNDSNPPSWVIVAGSEFIDDFIRKVVFERVSRDSFNGNIEQVYNPTNDDPDTRKAIITVSWEDKETKIITYFTNWQK